MRFPLPLAQVVFSAINHLLGQQPALAGSLRRYAGRNLRIDVRTPLDLFAGQPRKGLTVDARIGADGTLAAVSEPIRPAVTLTVSPSIDAAFALVREGPDGLDGHLAIEGDAMLAAAIGRVVSALRWDFEEDLSRVVGDVAAHRIGEGLREAARDGRELTNRARQTLTRRATQDAAGIVATADLTALREELQGLQVRIADLERRSAAAPVRPSR